MHTLVLLSSFLGDRSNSKKLADHLIARLGEQTGTIAVRDLAADPIPYFGADTVGALFTPADMRSDAQRDIVALSDALIAELQAADRVVFAVPTYNFSLPAQLKTYLDYVARAGVTFRYTPEGVPEGLLKGKQVFLLVARGGKALGTPDDTMTPYLKQMLGFLGMDDVTVIAAEGMAMGELAAAEGLAQAKAAIDALVAEPALA